MRDQEARTTQPIARKDAERILLLNRELEQLVASREEHVQVVAARDAVEGAKKRLAELQEALEQRRIEHEHAKRIAVVETELQTAGEQYLAYWSPTIPKTMRVDDLGGVQVKVKETLTVHDHEALARSLIEKDLWSAAKATVKVGDEKWVRSLAEKRAVEGATASEKMHLALLKP